MTVIFNIEAIKFLIKLCDQYEKTDEKTPHEYVKKLIELNGCDDKSSHLIEMFLELHKHDVFLTALVQTVTSKLRAAEKTSMKIILYGVLFRFDDYCFRKYLFNLELLIGSKLLKLYIDFFKRLDVILITKNVAQNIYDIAYVTETIISPFIKVQPYIQEILNDFQCFQKQEALKKIKPPTIPMNMNVLSRLGKKKKDFEIIAEKRSPQLDTILEVETVAEVHERNLKYLSRSNRKKAEEHLKEAQRLAGKYADTQKSSKYVETIENIELERIPPAIKLTKIPQYSQTPSIIKTNVSTLLRYSSNIIKEQENDIKWIEALCSGSYDSAAVDVLAYERKMQEEKEKMCSIEKKHLEGLLSYEDAIIAKENLLKKNKENYDLFMEEKHQWEKKLDDWKQLEQERIKNVKENNNAIKQAAIDAKESICNKKKEVVKDLKEQSDTMKNIIIKNKQEDLQKRYNTIKEIKVLQAVAKITRKEKTIDFTGTSGLGLMCEMSIAELKERLAVLRIDMKDELDSRKKIVLDLREKAKEKETRAQRIINEYLQDKKTAEKKSAKPFMEAKSTVNELDDEISLLKRKLEEKRQLRKKLISKTNSIEKVDPSQIVL